MLIGAIVFLIYSSSEPQPWAVVRDDENKNQIQSYELSHVTEKFLNTSEKVE